MFLKAKIKKSCFILEHSKISLEEEQFLMRLIWLLRYLNN